MDKANILVVDDEENLLSVLDMTLTSAGYSIITANNGKDAVVLAKSKCPDLIIMDLSMPGMDGDEVAEKLRHLPETKEIPILFLTALYSKEQQDAKGHVVGGNVFMAKPYETKTLLAMINKMLAENYSSSQKI